MSTYLNILSQIIDKLLDFMINCDLFVIAFISICICALFRFISVSYWFKGW